MDIGRILRHFTTALRLGRRTFSESDLRQIDEAIERSERSHSGEIVFIVETRLPLRLLLRAVSPRERALELFSRYRVWDTRHNNGVLLYLLLADRDIEIIADRGIDEQVGNDGWSRICGAAEQAFREGRFMAGVKNAVAAIGEHIQRCFPPAEGDRDELGDKPIVL